MEIPAANLEQNNAPLLDILFNLLIFFIMACEYSAQENIKLNTPRVTIEPQSVGQVSKDQLAFNLVPEPGKPENVKEWNVASNPYNPVKDGKKIKEVLVKSFLAAIQNGKQPEVILRADSSALYSQVYEAMGLVTEAFVEARSQDPRINLAISKKF